jgi:hypothetical protein
MRTKVVLRKFSPIIAVLLMATFVAYLRSRPQASGPDLNVVAHLPGGEQPHVANEAPRPPVARAHDVASPSEWPELAPLSDDEQKEFMIVQDQIVRFYDWGAMETDSVGRFRQALFAMAKRGLAHHARQLLLSSQETVKTPEDAKETIEKLDVLRYFVENGNAFAKEAAVKIMERGYRTDGDGAPVDRVEAQVALEAFEILSKADADTARLHLHSLPNNQVVAFSYHYLLGRRLASEAQDETLGYLATAFGPEMTSYMKQIGMI